MKKLAGNKKAREEQLDEAWWTFSDLIRSQSSGRRKTILGCSESLSRLHVLLCLRTPGTGWGRRGDWICAGCGVRLDRAQNAAGNLEHLAEKYIQEHRQKEEK